MNIIRPGAMRTEDVQRPSSPPWPAPASRPGSIGGRSRELPRRAVLHAELALARWLLHGVDAGRRDVAEDAAALLANLARSVEQRTAGALVEEAGPALSVGEVERMLDHQELLLASTAPVRLPTAQSSTEPLIALDHRSRNSASE